MDFQTKAVFYGLCIALLIIIILSLLDQYFARKQYESHDKEDTYIEVKLSDKKSLSELEIFYTNIYSEIFTDDNEKESYSNLIKYLKLDEMNNGKNYHYHIILLKDPDDKIIGGAIFDYFVKTNSAFIEFIAVKNSEQSIGNGTILYKFIKDILDVDAQKHGRATVDHIVCEVKHDNPYMLFWNKMDYKRLVMKYIQVPLEDGKHVIADKLWLLYQSPINNDSVNKKLIFDIIYDMMKYTMDINRPRDNKYYIDMMLSVDDDIKLLDLSK